MDPIILGLSAPGPVVGTDLHGHMLSFRPYIIRSFGVPRRSESLLLVCGVNL